MKKTLLSVMAAVCFLTFPLSAAEFYVSPTGTAQGNGGITSPWNLQTALNHPSAVKPGDTIWLRGGTYSGTYISNLNGTLAAPIIVRQYANERATLDGGSDANFILTINGGWTWYWALKR